MNKYIPIYIIIGALALTGCMRKYRVDNIPLGTQPMVTRSNPIVMSRTTPKVRTKRKWLSTKTDTRLNTQTYYGTSRTPPKN